MQFILKENRPIAAGVFRMTLQGDTRGFTRPGQFAQVQVPGFYLRRPLSVCDWQPGEAGSLTLVYKTIGHGTEAMGQMRPGTEMDLLTGLGNGFDCDQSQGARDSHAPLLLGGGVGTPPLYGLCRRLLTLGKTPTVALGFNTASEVILRADFEALGVPTLVSTVDGSSGVRGFVTDAAAAHSGAFDYLYACGPEPMLRAAYKLCEARDVGGQFSFEARMACGFGACMGCTCQTKYGPKRLCKDGPVLFREEIIW